jgi:hypothetical protein
MSRLHCAVEGLVISLILPYPLLDDPYLSMHYFVILSMRKSYYIGGLKIPNFYDKMINRGRLTLTDGRNSQQ